MREMALVPESGDTMDFLSRGHPGLALLIERPPQLRSARKTAGVWASRKERSRTGGPALHATSPG